MAPASLLALAVYTGLVSLSLVSVGKRMDARQEPREPEWVGQLLEQGR